MITATHKGRYYDVEYSIVNISELEGELRIDAEYYDPFYLKNEEKIKNKKWLFLKDCLVDGKIKKSSSFKRVYKEKGIPVILTQNIREVFLDFSQKFYTVKQAIKEKPKFKDILMTVTGANIGQNAIILERNKEFYLTTDAVIIRLNENVVNPFYFIVLLNTESYGKKNIKKYIYGMSQPHLSLSDFIYFKVPITSEEFQNSIGRLVLKAYEEKKKAEELYKQAEEILLEELGLKDWKPKTKKIKIGGKEFGEEENISIKKLSEVIKADRMDAEYWEPKYDEIEELIKNYKNGWNYLPNLVEISKEKIKIDKEKTYNYIELADINSNLGVVNQTKEIKGENLPSRARMKVEKGYVIMSSVEGSIDKIALIDFEKDNLVASTGFFVFKEKEINKETLLILLKILAKKYLIREAQGTILTAIPYDSLNRIIIPKVDQQIQQKISQLIQQSFKARENSKKLLEIAKKAVEIYIENDEEEGINYSKKLLKLYKLDID